MAVVSTGLNNKSIQGEFFRRLEITPTVFESLAMRITSNSDTETYRWLGSVPQMRQWSDGRLAAGLRSETYTVDNQKYEATIEVDRDEITDDQTGQLLIRVGELAERAATHKDRLISDLLANGESAGFTAFDGKTFFATDHVSGDSGSQSNKLDFDISVKMPSDPDTPDSPSVPTLTQAFNDALGAMLQFKDDRGEPMDIAPSGMIVICHPSVFLSWTTAVGAAIGNEQGSTLPQFGIRVIPMGRLTDASKFYLLKTDGVVRPFIFQDREAIEFGARTERSDDGFRNEQFLYGVRARYRVTYGLWQHAVRINLI